MKSPSHLGILCLTFLLTSCQASVPAGDRATHPASGPASRPAKVKITISRETTYISGPVNPDGTINYVAYLNEKYSKGVTADNNAGVAILRILGPNLIDEPIRGKTYALLQMNMLPDTGDYFLTYRDYVEKTVPEPDQKGAIDQHEPATRYLWSAKMYPVVAQWLSTQEDHLAALCEASKLPRYYIPLVCPGQTPCVLGAVLPRLSLCLDAAKALVARALLRANAGDLEGARADLAATRRLARLFSQDPVVLGWLVGMSAASLAAKATERLVITGNLPPRQLKAMLEELNATPPLPDIRETISKERFCGLDAIMIAARGSVHSLRELVVMANPGRPQKQDALLLSLQKERPDWDETLRTYNRWFDDLAEPIQGNRTTKQERSWEAANNDYANLRAKLRELGSEEGWLKDVLRTRKETPAQRRKRIGKETGDLLSAIFMPRLARAITLHKQAITEVELARTATALAVYKADTGKFPDNLAALAPKYVKTVPVDVFGGRPLVYKTRGKGYLLYSIGSNLKDDGGKDDYEEGDIVVRVE